MSSASCSSPKNAGVCKKEMMELHDDGDKPDRLVRLPLTVTVFG